MSIAVLAVLSGSVLTVRSAGAEEHHSVCNDGDVLGSRVYRALEIVGSCVVPDGANVRVIDGMTLDVGSNFDQMSVSSLRVDGDIRVRSGATLSIGCTIIGMECAGDSVDRVNGDIRATNALTLHIDGVTVNGDVRSSGGGGMPGDQFETFAFKDNTVKGDVIITGWNGGGWIGMIRNTVGGSVVYSNNTALDYTQFDPHPNDAHEITHNTVKGDLSCWGNSPAAQFGDSVPPLPDPYRWNVVKGRASGECAALVEHRAHH